jgi:hypothetical protein
LPRAVGCGQVIVKNIQSRQKALNNGLIACNSCRFFGAIGEFDRSNCADAELRVSLVECLPNHVWLVLDSEDADVRVEHELEHYKSSRL